MAKRFTDSKRFDDPWYRRLTIKQKIIWEYLLSECSHAGILEKIDLDLISFKIGETITFADIQSLGDRIVFVNEDVLFIPNFLKFQYEELNPYNKVHKSVLKALNKYGIQAPIKLLSSPYEGVKVKDKVKVKVKDKVKDKSIEVIQEEKKENKKEKKEEVDGVNPDIYVKGFKEYFDIYRDLCPDLIKLTYEPRNRECIDNLNRFVNETNSDLEYFKSLCQKGNTLKTIVSNPIDFNILITKHIRIMSGFYTKGKTGGELDRKAAIEAALKKSKWRDAIT